MDDVKLSLDENKKGAFLIKDGSEILGEMAISITGDKLIAEHTEVSPKAEGKGLAKKLLAEMVKYARENKLKVIPLCPFVNAQFKRHPEEYADIWN